MPPHPLRPDRWLKSVVPISFRNRLRRRLDAEIVIDRWPSPPWVEQPAEQTVRKWMVDDCYLTTIERDEPVRIEPEEAFSWVDLELANLLSVEAVRLEATGTTVDGNERTTVRTVRPEATMHSRDVRVPVRISFDEPLSSLSLTIHTEGEERSDPSLWIQIWNRLSSVEYRSRQSLRVGQPTPGIQTDRPPILILSLDSVRHDQQDELAPLLDALGDDVVIPAEPRTQGHWTPAAHGSLFTSLHPGDHGYVGTTDPDTSMSFNDGVTRLTEVLGGAEYRCSMSVAHSRILPENGFGRGARRFQYNPMLVSRWVDRENDARETIDEVISWLDADGSQGASNLCYFVHLFDPHYPYIPPVEQVDGDLDFQSIRRYQEFISERTIDEQGGGYVNVVETRPQLDPELVGRMRGFYRQSVEYTARQAARLVGALDRRNLLDPAFVLVVGDHGEEFGERGFYLHQSLYDDNIRPFMAVKPPADADWTVPDRADFLDVLPTVARLVGADPPSPCQGRAWQEDDPGGDDARITERIREASYNVAVELEGVKGIFTYESGFPERPTTKQIEAGPILEEFYRLEEVRAGNYDGHGEIGSEIRERLRSRASEFLDRPRLTDPGTQRTQPSTATKEQLQDLGYR